MSDNKKAIERAIERHEAEIAANRSGPMGNPDEDRVTPSRRPDPKVERKIRETGVYFPDV